MAEDRRIRYTKMVLCESLIKLMKEKPISRISIKAICENADINRATYYAHYTDQFDQLNKIELEFIEGIEKLLEGMTETNPVDIITKIFDYIEANHDLCCTLLSPNGDIAFEDKVSQLIRQNVLASMKDLFVEEHSTADYIYTYIFTGSVGIVKKWLTDKSGKFSSHDMAKLLLGLTDKGTGKKIH
jgi:AcrR family transcriptional regulator